MCHLAILKLFYILSSPNWSLNLKSFLFASWLYVSICWRCMYLHLHLHASVGWWPLGRRTFSNRPFSFPAKWVDTQTCFSTLLLEGLDQLLSCYKFGKQRVAERMLGTLPMWPGQYTEHKYCDEAFTIDIGAAAASVIVEKCKYLSSVNYIKELNADLNYEWSVAAACLGRGTFKGMHI